MIGSTQHIVGVCVNRVGTDLPNWDLTGAEGEGRPDRGLEDREDAVMAGLRLFALSSLRAGLWG